MVTSISPGAATVSGICAKATGAQVAIAPIRKTGNDFERICFMFRLQILGEGVEPVGLGHPVFGSKKILRGFGEIFAAARRAQSAIFRACRGSVALWRIG